MNVGFSDVAEYTVFLRDISDLHDAVWVLRIRMKGDDGVVAAVQLITDNPGAKGIAVQSDHQIQHRRPITGFDHSRIFVIAQDLFGEVEGAFVSLLKGQAGIVLELIKTDRLFLCERVVFPYIHVSVAFDQLVK